ncbi:MAG: SAM-dependent methyltransferase [Prevotellaceae bacterium]|jgi:16S rRNA (cytidine1402-2'-O)-methyltransferase|nr:SAM-dependent methyltransferase [Prevotellaceae bacterium]
MISAGKLFLIPAPIGEKAPIEAVISAGTLEIIRSIRYFVVEELRTARRYLSKANIGVAIDSLHFFELNEHTPPEFDLSAYLQAALDGHDVALLSEAGAPAVADPGARLVHLAHQKNIAVVPLTGPSSLLLALMASGLNGQNFAFVGYLPVKSPERQQRLRQLEKRSAADRQTQLFIETPYRNEALLSDILSTCRPNTLLCVAANLTEPDALIKTQTIAEWKTTTVDLRKKPCVFLMISD